MPTKADWAKLEKSKRTKTAYIDAATIEFGLIGFDGASTAKIHERARAAQGLKENSLFYHFSIQKNWIRDKIADETSGRNREFGPKTILYEHALAALFDPLTERRHCAIDAIESAASGKKPSIEDLCDAYIRPLFEHVDNHKFGKEQALMLLRLGTEEQVRVFGLIREEWIDPRNRLLRSIAALRKVPNINAIQGHLHVIEIIAATAAAGFHCDPLQNEPRDNKSRADDLSAAITQSAHLLMADDEQNYPTLSQVG